MKKNFQHHLSQFIRVATPEDDEKELENKKKEKKAYKSVSKK